MGPTPNGKFHFFFLTAPKQDHHFKLVKTIISRFDFLTQIHSMPMEKYFRKVMWQE